MSVYHPSDISNQQQILFSMQDKTHELIVVKTISILFGYKLQDFRCKHHEHSLFMNNAGCMSPGVILIVAYGCHTSNRQL